MAYEHKLLPGEEVHAKNISYMTPAELAAFRVAMACCRCAMFNSCLISRRIFIGTLAESAKPQNFDRLAAIDCQSRKNTQNH